MACFHTICVNLICLTLQLYISTIYFLIDFRRLCLYPSGNKKSNGNGHISLYLVIKDTNELTRGWELNVHFKLFVYNNLEDNYLTVQGNYFFLIFFSFIFVLNMHYLNHTDAGVKTRRFHALKTEWGFSQLLSLGVFKDTSNGYLYQDTCIFGAEILIIKNSGKGECISWIKEPANKCFTWKVVNFSAITVSDLHSDEFTVGEQKWKLSLVPIGNGKAKGEWLSVFLNLANSSTTFKHKIYARYKLQIKDRFSNKYFEGEGKEWFSSSSSSRGFHKFKKLSDMKDSSKRFIATDTLIVEVEFMVISAVKELT